MDENILILCTFIRVLKDLLVLLATQVPLVPKEHLVQLVHEVWLDKREREVVMVWLVSLANQDQRDHKDNVACLEHQEDLDRR